MRSLTLAAAVLTLVPLGASGQTAAAAQTARLKKAAASITAADLTRDVTYLASDALKGRASITRDFAVSPGYDSAATYIARHLRQLGVKPGGDNGTYFRHYTLRRTTLDTMKTRATVSGATAATLKYGTDFAVRSFNATGVFNAPIVYVGNGIRMRDGSVDPYKDLDVRGKWLLVAPASAGARPPSMAVAFNADEEARLRGALGILTIAAPPAVAPAPSNAPGTAAAPGRAGGRAGGPRVISVTDIVPGAGRSYAPYPLPRVTLLPSGLAMLLQNEHVSLAELQAGTAPSFALRTDTPLRIELAGMNEATIQHYNVVGIIEGSDASLKHEYISIASHLDGAVGNGVLNGDSVYNAADDNASGSAGNMAIARGFMSGPRPKRSILLIWDSGEEVGLWGSRAMAYSRMADSIVTHINVDMIGRTDPKGIDATGDEALSGPGEIYVSGPRILSSYIDGVLDRVSRDYNYIAFDRQFESATSQYFYPRSDASPYFERGIPFIEFFSGMHGDYHAQGDESSKLDPSKMEAVARSVYVTAWHLADNPTKPTIDKPIPANLPFIVVRK